MSRRPLLILAAVVALAAPAAASARPADSTFTPAVAAADSTFTPAVTAADSTLPPAGHTTVGSDSSGSGTLTVLAVAGGTLLLGAAAGFGGGRLTGRRRIVGS